ncbi:MAG: hypothetical protein M1834_008826 [Cirrosporium novae-zelandiae]|nr:MAG: hypothetical protein M1834_008826 [Cirrosporium novae-zelandiae]
MGRRGKRGGAKGPPKSRAEWRKTAIRHSADDDDDDDNDDVSFGRWGSTPQSSFSRSNNGTVLFIHCFYMVISDFALIASSSYYSMADAARNTERRQFNGRYTPLRFNQVTFVSAETPPSTIRPKEDEMDGTQDHKSQAHKAKSKWQQYAKSGGVDAVSSKESACPARSRSESPEPVTFASFAHGPGPGDLPYFMDTCGSKSRIPTNLPPPYIHSPTLKSDLPFFVDTTGSKSTVQTGLPLPSIHLSSSKSDSSDDEVVFIPRNRLSTTSTTTVLPTRSSQPQIISGDKNRDQTPPKPELYQVDVETTIEKAMEVSKSGIVKEETSEFITLESTRPVSGISPRGSRKSSKRQEQRERKERERQQKKTLQDEVFADYIANMQDDGSADDLQPDSPFNKRDLGGSDDEIMDDKAEPSENVQQKSKISDWDSIDLQDLDDLSTSEGLPIMVSMILSKRERPSGTQYLVVYGGQSTDEARWVASEGLQENGAGEQIALFEEDELNVPKYPSDPDPDDESESKSELPDEEAAIGDANDALEDELDEQDLIQRRIDKMTDEQIARSLAKQEELGLGSSEVLLFDGSFEDIDTDVMDVDEFITKKTSGPSASASRESRYRGEDTTKKFKLKSALDSPPSWDNIEDELKGKIQEQWKKDRVKKAGKKREREELRAQGLLGRKNGTPNLHVKYKDGITLGEVKEEIIDFLVSSRTSLALPPMDKPDRIAVHSISNRFKLKSKSQGDKHNRFPILTKTKATALWTEINIPDLESRINMNRFLPRPDKGKGRNRDKTRKPDFLRGGGGVASGVGYRDGDIVGASAPELGADNKGRAMLEKMGWSHGMGLGAADNKGILQPVAHVVKTTRSGLG